MATPNLICGDDASVPMKNGIQAAVIRFLRKIKGCHIERIGTKTRTQLIIEESGKIQKKVKRAY